MKYDLAHYHRLLSYADVNLQQIPSGAIVYTKVLVDVWHQPFGVSAQRRVHSLDY